jgi:uncharacterized membrane protein
LLAPVAAACSGPDASCPNDLPASCPSDAPGYAATIAPLIQARCATCHAPGGQAGDRPLVTYDDVFSRRSAVLDQVYGCRMPPAGGTALTSDERSALLAWLVCGAPHD